MRKSTRTAAALLGALVLTGVTAVSASAAEDGTDVTVAVEAGLLSISVPGALDFGTIAPNASATIALEAITVTDARATTGSWATTITVGQFTSTPPVDSSFGAEQLSYAAGEANVSESGPSVVAASVTGGDSITPVQNATGVNGNNTATWDADVTLTIPGQALATAYTATLTHSVL